MLFRSAHTVGIFDASSQALLVSGILPSGSAGTLQDGFRWQSIPEVLLMPGNYVMAATSSGDPASFDPFLYEGTNPVTADGFNLDGTSLSASGSGTVLSFPGYDEGLSYGFFGPNMAGYTPAPGPLPLLGAASALAWSRRLRSRLRR